MIQLLNSQLLVNILDPIADQSHLGSRYVTGGYIYQVADMAIGNLLSGPQFPNPNPPVFDGQGLPEVFETALGADNAEIGTEVEVLGVGRVLRESKTPFHPRANPNVTDWSLWEIKSSSQQAVFKTRRSYGPWKYTLQRTVSLKERELTSKTELINQGDVFIPIRWFAHPFFPQLSDRRCCSFAPPATVPMNKGFTMDTEGIVHMKADYNWPSGCFQQLGFSREKPLEIKQFHPKIGEIKIRTDFPVSDLPIWANANTFSFEPYFTQTLNPSATIAWEMIYSF